MSLFRNKNFRHSGESRNLVPIIRGIPAFAGMTVVVVLLFLSGCGFEPLHAEKKTASLSRPGIEIDNIPDQDGQYLRNRLIDILYTQGRPFDAPYQLKISPLEKNITNMGIQGDATATRAQLQITTQMQLIEKSTAAVLLQRNLKTIGAYNLLDNQLATLVSQQNIAKNILQALGDDVVTELDLYFHRNIAPSAQ